MAQARLKWYLRRAFSFYSIYTNFVPRGTNLSFHSVIGRKATRKRERDILFTVEMLSQSVVVLARIHPPIRPRRLNRGFVRRIVPTWFRRKLRF